MMLLALSPLIIVKTSFYPSEGNTSGDNIKIFLIAILPYVYAVIASLTNKKIDLIPAIQTGSLGLIIGYLYSQKDKFRNRIYSELIKSKNEIFSWSNQSDTNDINVNNVKNKYDNKYDDEDEDEDEDNIKTLINPKPKNMVDRLIGNFRIF